MTQQQIHPFYLLRQKIKGSLKQYRYNSDNSPSLFQPKQGFVHAYEISKVEDALDAFEETLGEEYQASKPAQSPEEVIIEAAKKIHKFHPSVDARDFASAVLAYIQDKNQSPEMRIVKALEWSPKFE